MSTLHTELLRSALLSGEEAVAAFHAWQAMVHLDHLPSELHGLLPLLYRNLEESGIEHPWLPRLKGIYRRAWYLHRAALHSLAPVLTALHAQDLPVLLVGGTALGQTVYPAPALRPHPISELVVPDGRVTQALAALHALGWRPEPASPHLDSPAFRAWVAGQRFVNGQGQALWLGWHVVPTLPCADLDGACWAAATDLTLDGRPLRTLCPADHLLRACLTAQSGSLIDLADAAWVMRCGGVEWPHFVELAGRFRAGWPALRLLECLAETVALAPPPEVLAALRGMPGFFAEKRMGMGALSHPLSKQGRLWRLLARYQRTAACAGGAADPRSFVAYLQHTRHLDSPWGLPQAALRSMLG
jgi:hypothetical protein